MTIRPHLIALWSPRGDDAAGTRRTRHKRKRLAGIVGITDIIGIITATTGERRGQHQKQIRKRVPSGVPVYVCDARRLTPNP
jgi:hypothetical protein